MSRLQSFPVVVLLALGVCGPLVADQPAHHTFRYLTTGGSPQKLSTMVFSPAGNQLAVSVAGRIDFIDLNQGRVTGQYKDAPFTMTYTKDGARLYMIARRKSVLLDISSGAELPKSYEVEPGYIGLRLEKESGKLLISHINEGGPLAKIDAIQAGDELIGVAEGRGGRMQKVTGNTSEQVVKLLGGPAGSYLQLKILPRGTFGEQNAKRHVVRRVPGEKLGGSLKLREYAPPQIDDRLAWCGSDGRLQFRSAASGMPIAHLQTIDIDPRGRMAISPDHKRFAVVARRKVNTSTNAVEVFDIATQERLASMPVPKNSFYDLDFAADNNRVLVATWDSVEIADVAQKRFTGRLMLGWTPKKPEKPKRSFGGATSAVKRAAADAVAYNESNQPRSPEMLVSELAVSPKRIVATADAKGRVKLWDLGSGELLKEMPKNPAKEAQAIEFSPDGNWLAYYLDGVLHVVDVSEIEPLSSEEKSSQQVGALAQKATKEPGHATKAPKDVASLTVRVGARVEVSSRGKWYPAMIVRDEGKGRWQIHYDDSPEDWDELVSEKRIRRRSDR